MYEKEGTGRRKNKEGLGDNFNALLILQGLAELVINVQLILEQWPQVYTLLSCSLAGKLTGYL